MRAVLPAFRILFVVMVVSAFTLSYVSLPANAQPYDLSAALDDCDDVDDDCDDEETTDYHPVANPDNSITLEGRPVETSILANDRDLIDTPIWVRISDYPQYGWAFLRQEDGVKVRYIPIQGFTGSDTYEYSVCDRDLDCDRALVTVTVQPVTDDPVSPDTIPPTVAWEAPVKEGGVLNVGNQKVTLIATASDNVGVERVTFMWWDAVGEQYTTLGEREHSPYEVSFNTSILRSGWNQIFVRSVDGAGNSSDYPFIWLYKAVMDHHVYLPYTRR